MTRCYRINSQWGQLITSSIVDWSFVIFRRFASLIFDAKSRTSGTAPSTNGGKSFSSGCRILCIERCPVFDTDATSSSFKIIWRCDVVFLGLIRIFYTEKHVIDIKLPQDKWPGLYDPKLQLPSLDMKNSAGFLFFSEFGSLVSTQESFSLPSFDPKVWPVVFVMCWVTEVCSNDEGTTDNGSSLKDWDGLEESKNEKGVFLTYLYFSLICNIRYLQP